MEKEPIKKSNILKWALILGIMVVVNLFFNFAIATIYDSPEYSNFCENKQVVELYETQNECVAVGGQWNENRGFTKIDPRGIEVPTSIVDVPAGYCNVNFTCGQEFSEARSVYDRNVFIVLTIIGAALIIGSVLLVGVEAVSMGLALGGVLSLVIGTMRYWSNMDEYLRVIVLGLALIALIWVGGLVSKSLRTNTLV